MDASSDYSYALPTSPKTDSELPKPKNLPKSPKNAILSSYITFLDVCYIVLVFYSVL